MPQKNIIKPYVANGIYHLYNRGVEKRMIFLDQKDYAVFLRFLKDALSDPAMIEKTPRRIKHRRKNFYGKLDLLAYCLMPNHFHLLIKQHHERTIKEFMQTIATRYSMYFNWRYKRVGTLFQSNYRGILISDEPYLLHVSRYIHRNPNEQVNDLSTAYSSYADYIGKRATPWVKPHEILSYFSSEKNLLPRKHNSYQSFVEYSDETTLDTETMIHEMLGM